MRQDHGTLTATVEPCVCPSCGHYDHTILGRYDDSATWECDACRAIGRLVDGVVELLNDDQHVICGNCGMIHDRQDLDDLDKTCCFHCEEVIER